jgi:hypothetical protein
MQALPFKETPFFVLWSIKTNNNKRDLGFRRVFKYQKARILAYLGPPIKIKRGYGGPSPAKFRSHPIPPL